MLWLPNNPEKLVALLGHANWDVRKKALRRLWSLDPYWFESENARRNARNFISSLYASNPYIRVAACEVLGLIRDKSAIGPLVSALKDEYMDVRAAAKASLEKIDRNWRGSRQAKEKIPELIGDLQNVNDHITRGFAARILGWVGDGTAAGPLIAALNDENYDVRRFARISLDSVCPAWRQSGEARESVPQFVAGLRNQNECVRRASATVLGMIGDRDALVPLIDAIEDTGRVCAKAVEALVEMGDQRAIRPIVRALDDGRIGDSLAIRALTALIGPRMKCLDCFPKVVCSGCFRRAVKLTISENPSKPDTEFPVCPSCYMAANLMTNIATVVGVIAEKVERPRKQNPGMFVVSIWDESAKKAGYADIDRLVIRAGQIESYQRAVNAVILELTSGGNKANGNLKNITVEFEGNPPISAGVLRMLEDNFRLA